MHTAHDPAYTAILRDQIQRLDRKSIQIPSSGAHLSSGFIEVDRCLGGGLNRGTIHEVIGGGHDALYGTRPAQFIASILAATSGRIAWIGAHRLDLHATALREIGLNPGRLICVEAPAEQVASISADALHEPGLAVVVAEIDSALDLITSRQLLDGAHSSGATGFLIPRGHFVAGNHAMPASVSTTRWRVTPRPYLVRDASSHHHEQWTLELLHNAGGARSRWDVDAPTSASVPRNQRETPQIFDHDPSRALYKSA